MSQSVHVMSQHPSPQASLPATPPKIALLSLPKGPKMMQNNSAPQQAPLQSVKTFTLTPTHGGAGGASMMMPTHQMVKATPVMATLSPSKIVIKPQDGVAVGNNKYQFIRVVKQGSPPHSMSSLAVSQVSMAPKSATAVPVVQGQGHKVNSKPAMTNVVQKPIMPALTIKSSSGSQVKIAGTIPIELLAQSNAILQASSSGLTLVSANSYLQQKPQTPPFSEKPPSQNSGSTTPVHVGHFEVTGKQRKPCNCTKSQCLKLYCECFANGEFCHGCNCTNCYNNLEHEEERSKAVKVTLERNPQAFHPKIRKFGFLSVERGKDGAESRHVKGCNCKKSGCLKNYCECYEAKILCTSLCKCIGCKNYDDSSNDKKSLMQLADAAEVRTQQQGPRLRSQESSEPEEPPSIAETLRKPPHVILSDLSVVESVISCLVARAEESTHSKDSEPVAEFKVLEEFGRAIMQIITCSQSTKYPNSVHS